METPRPTPDTLLKRVQAQERHEGKLKIYLGAAPGVGKTYSMLQDALILREQGLDVVSGIVETHGRSETGDLAKQFEILPPQMVEYRGKQISEFNLDLALKRKPALILIDEMAHTNTPGLRHAKRWQDIKEVLAYGIDVYTTLNIQHVESLNDVIAQILHINIKETVPDPMLETAEIELVDIAPEDLFKRLQQGKIYFPQQAEIAAENFFRKGNIIALRELALRVAAQHVGDEVFLYRQIQGIHQIWPSRNKLLVCVGPGTGTTKLIRAARRLATSLQAKWIAVHVDVPRWRYTEERRNQAIQNLHFAEQLGAETHLLTGFSIVKEILAFAREQNVTQILVWKEIRPRWKDLLFGSLANEIVRKTGEIDVYIMTGNIPVSTSAQFVNPKAIPWRIYVISIGIVGVATFTDYILHSFLNTSLIMVYLLGITLVALFGRMGPSIVASILSVLAYAYFFMPPFFTATFTENFQFFFTLMVMLVISQIISYLTIVTRQQREFAQFTERYTAALHQLSRQLASTRGVDKLLEIGLRYIAEVFNSQVWGLLPEKSGRLVIHGMYGTKQPLDDKEQSVAQWVYDLGQMAGLGTDTLPFSDSIYLPLLATKGVIGVIKVRPAQPKRLFTPEQMELLGACTSQIALSLEVDRLQT